MRRLETSWRMLARELPRPRLVATSLVRDESFGSRKAQAGPELLRFVLHYGRAVVIRMDRNLVTGRTTCQRRCAMVRCGQRYQSVFVKETCSWLMDGLSTNLRPESLPVRLANWVSKARR